MSSVALLVCPVEGGANNTRHPVYEWILHAMIIILLPDIVIDLGWSDDYNIGCPVLFDASLEAKPKNYRPNSIIINE